MKAGIRTMSGRVLLSLSLDPKVQLSSAAVLLVVVFVFFIEEKGFPWGRWTIERLSISMGCNLFFLSFSVAGAFPFVKTTPAYHKNWASR